MIIWHLIQETRAQPPWGLPDPLLPTHRPEACPWGPEVLQIPETATGPGGSAGRRKAREEPGLSDSVTASLRSQWDSRPEVTVRWPEVTVGRPEVTVVGWPP